MIFERWGEFYLEERERIKWKNLNYKLVIIYK